MKISELRLVVVEYIDHLSDAYKKHTGVGFSPEEKREMVEDTIAKMKTRGFYAYIDP